MKKNGNLIFVKLSFTHQTIYINGKQGKSSFDAMVCFLLIYTELL